MPICSARAPGRLLAAASASLLCAFLGSALAQTDDLRQVRDINTDASPLGSAPYPLDSPLERQPVVLAGVAYFPASDGTSGVELWRSDGTAAGTFLVRDINPDGGSRVQQLTVVAGTLFFVADDGTTGAELWRSDGSAAGTTLVADINPDAGVGSAILELTAVGGELLFTANDGINGRELWRSDGTAAGTVMVPELVPGEDGSGVAELAALGSTLFFRADDDSGDGTALWQWTAAGGVELVEDTDPRAGLDDVPRDMTSSGGRLFFVADQPGSSITTATGQELWAHDPGTGDTERLSDIFPGGTPPGATVPVPGINSLVDAGGTLYFRATDNTLGPDGLLGNQELYTSDGTPAGTRRVADLNDNEAGLPRSDQEPDLLPVGGGSAYFRATEGDDVELAVSDGATVTFLTDLNADPFDPSDLVAAGGNVFFGAVTDDEGRELWVTDGTVAGTRLVRDIRPGDEDSMVPLDDEGSQRVELGGSLLFRANDGVTGLELWRSDGTALGTSLVRDIRPGIGTDDARVGSLAVFAGQVYFGADDGLTGRELWRSDGTAAGTERVADIAPGLAGGDPQELTVAGGNLFFRARRASDGEELWRSNGTTTERVADIDPGSAGSRPRELAPVGSRLYFSADDGVDGREPWFSGGVGAIQLEDINPGGHSSPREFTDLAGLALFSADNGNGRELWVSAGTELTTEIRDLAPAGGSNPAELTVVGNRAFFRADDGSNGPELWVAGGTTFSNLTARQVTDIRSGADGSSPRELTAFDGRLFFTADDGVTGRELWVSDGSAGGTRLLVQIEAGPDDGQIRDLTPVGGQLFFVARNEVAGEELWVTDGTAAGTRLAADIRIGPAGSNPSRLSAVGDTLVFAADDGRAGTELWRSDGTAAGTERLDSINPDGAAEIGTPVTLGDTVFFPADDDRTGTELWAATVAGEGSGGGIGIGDGGGSGALGPWWLLGLAGLAALGGRAARRSPGA